MIFSRFPKMTVLLAVNICVLGFLVFGFGREYLRNREIDANISQLQEENKRLSDEKSASLSLIDSLSSAYYVEGEDRIKNGQAKPGETLVIIDGGTKSNDASGAEDDASGGLSNPALWFLKFFGRSRFLELSRL